MRNPLSNSKTTAEAARPKRPTISELGRAAILAEQLSYLLSHAGSCPDGCPACIRLRSVEQILLQPFTVAPTAYAVSAVSCGAGSGSTPIGAPSAGPDR